MPNFTKQDVTQISNALLLISRGKYEMLGSEARILTGVMDFLSKLRDELIKEIQSAELAQKAAEEAKALKAKEALEKTKDIIDGLLIAPAVEGSKAE